MRYTFVFSLSWSPHRITASDACVSTTWTITSRRGEFRSDQRSRTWSEFLKGLLVLVDTLITTGSAPTDTLSLDVHPINIDVGRTKYFQIAIQNPMSNTMMKTGSPGHYTYAVKQATRHLVLPAVI